MSWRTVTDLADVADVVSVVCLTVGCALALVAAIGMVRFPDLLSRMHAATKPQVLGLLLVLLGTVLRLRQLDAVGMLLMVAVFQLATTPIASHMVARASFRAGQVREDLLLVDELSEVLEGPEEPRGAP